MDVAFHHRAQRRVHGAMPCQWHHSGKRIADDIHREMPAPIARADMADMSVAVIDYFQRRRGEGRRQQCFHARNPLRIGGGHAHGNTRLNGRTSTRV